MDLLLIGLSVLIGVPVVSYFTVKFATVAFYRGRQVFRESIEERKNDNGQK